MDSAYLNAHNTGPGAGENHVYKIKRLFKDSADEILAAYKGYDNTFFNPVTPRFIDRCMIDGEFWQVYEGKDLAACVYFIPACSARFKGLNAAWECRDLLNSDLCDTAICGYIAPATGMDNARIYSRLFKLSRIYAAKIGARQLLYYTPVKLYCPWRRLFSDGFVLRGLRGLDNAVANYIFTASALINYGARREYSEDLKCNLADTKQLSMLLEHGYLGHRLNEQNEIILGR